MANCPDLNKKQLGALIPLELYAKMRKEAEAHKMTITEYVTWTLEREVRRVELSADDYRWIAEQVEVNKVSRNKRR